ncbi:hypothetical protein PIB30_054664 [Stylosanthes scabra]|uniref:DUF4283 domain-containing protein n=1 Tax=Stylosanthes scabra TaxID=79078 RepID=A0ABU6RIX3_9FABA|nr:hypothetical protein [Stylosanthes scabra]
MREENKGELLRVKHGEETGKADERNKGESVGRFASGVKEGNTGGGQPLMASRYPLGIRQDDSWRPKVSFSEEGSLSELYIDSLVVKVLRKRIIALVHRLKHIWRLRGGYEILEVGNGYLLVKCDIKEDREKVLIWGQCMIDGH